MGFLSLATEKGYQGPLLKEYKGYEGHPPVLKIKVVMSKVVFKWPPELFAKMISTEAVVSQCFRSGQDLYS